MTGTDSSADNADPGLTLLGIYLNDHYAGSTSGLELFRRAEAHHRGTPVGETLSRLVTEVAEDRRALLEMMTALGVPVRQYKVAGAWAIEKVGRLKPNGPLKLNGRLLRRSPLSDLVEFEGMRLGVEGKVAGWRVLRVAAGRYDSLDPDRLDNLIARARRQADTLEELRLQAAAAVVGATTSS